MHKTKAMRCENLPNGSGFFNIATKYTEIKVITHIKIIVRILRLKKICKFELKNPFEIPT